MPPLLRKPQNRTVESLENHYEVERQLADRLRASNREERRQILATMYDELFAKVPDHPRLTRRRGEELTRQYNQGKMSLISSFLRPDMVFLEFGAGDCEFAKAVASRVKKVYAVDIADQRNPDNPSPANMELVVYDGYNLDVIPDNSIDLVFSDQLIEHLHPDDSRDHFILIRRILKPGGIYLIRTPHAMGGPHDISKYFSDVPQGFHMKEWTHAELEQMVQGLGYTDVRAYRNVKGWVVRMPMVLLRPFERLLSICPRSIRVPLVGLLFHSLVMSIRK
jgi:ubiquinone/menaquinone biosynthesis C-methylase UbiE